MRRQSLIAFFVVALTACGPHVRPVSTVDPVALGAVQPSRPPVPGAPAVVIAFVDVNVIPMDRERVLEHQTVLVDAGRINVLGRTTAVTVPPGAMRIDGRGKFLIPGLADMHTHLGLPTHLPWHPDTIAAERQVERELFLMAANGVTAIRNVNYMTAAGDSATAVRGWGTGILNWVTRRVRGRAAAGALWSPLIYTSARWRILGDTQSIEANLAAYKAAGYDFVKLHGEGGPLLDSIATAARHLGIPIMGHVGSDFGSHDSVRVAIADGYSSIEHLSGYPGGGISDGSVGPDTVQLPELIAATQRAGLWNCPTQILYDLTDSNPFRWPETRYDTVQYNPFWQSDTAQVPTLAPQKLVWLKLRRRIIKGLQDAGAGLLLGTDMPAVVAGFGVHRELQALVRAGLTPYQALATGTRNPAVFLGASDERGTVSVGKRADLVLLNGNPLIDIRQSGNIAGVMIGGRWLGRAAIDEQLAWYVKGEP